MTRIWTIFLLASAAPGADVTLWTSGRTLVDNSVRCSAMEQTVRMFETIGVGVEWKNASVDEHVSIEVRFATGVVGHPGAWAFSTPFDPQPVVTVMYDRIIADTASQQTLRAPVL